MIQFSKVRQSTDVIGTIVGRHDVKVVIEQDGPYGHRIATAHYGDNLNRKTERVCHGKMTLKKAKDRVIDFIIDTKL